VPGDDLKGSGERPAPKGQTNTARELATAEGGANAKAVADAAAALARQASVPKETLDAAAALARQASVPKETLDAAADLARRWMIPKGLTEPQVQEALRAFRDSETRYTGLIDQARGTATYAHGLAGAQIAQPTEVELPEAENVELQVLEATHGEITRVAGIVAAMADQTASLLEVARDAQAGLISLPGSAAATVDETGRLREALVAGQKSADRAAKSLTIATWVLVVLTFAIVILTAVLVSSEWNREIEQTSPPAPTATG